jgi:putative transposase
MTSIAAKKEFSVPAYCVMPDHLHLLLEGLQETSDLQSFIHSFKQSTGFAYQSQFHTQLWQSRYYDHVLRRACDTETVAWYVWLNPVRKGLCTAPQEYPLSGLQTIDWKNRCAPVQMWLPPWKLKPVPRV